MQRLAPLVLLALALAPALHAQELNCTVTVDRQSLAGNEYAFLDDMRDDVVRYLNTRAWTDDVWQPRERIDCTVTISLTSAPTLTSFAGQIVVQASRPVYGTGQRTPTLTVRDEAWAFAYTRGQSLVYDPNRFDAFLSVLDYYAFLILGYDYDSFSEMGGTPHFEEARRIAELGRSNGAALGWDTAGEERTRYTLVQQLLDPAFAALRRAQFTYHFAVLDRFVLGPETAWTEALAAFRSLHELYLQFNRRRYATDVFFGTKYQEIVDLLRDAPQRNEAYALLSEMDATHRGAYDGLVNRR